MFFIILLHFIFSSFIGIILSGLLGKLTPLIGIISLISGTIFALLCRKVFNKEEIPDFKASNMFEIIIIGFIFLIGFRHFSYLLYYSKNGINTLLHYNLGDLPLHISYIRTMSTGACFPPVDPIYTFDLLRYPPGIDFYSALWDNLGVPLTGNLFLTGFGLLLTAVVFLKWWGGVLLTGAFFLSGSFAGWQYFFNGFRLENFQESFEFQNFFLQHFIPQRGFLIAIPLGIFLLKTGYDYIKMIKIPGKNQAILYGFLWGILPLFHVHSFIAVSFILTGYFIFYAFYPGKSYRDFDFRSLFYKLKNLYLIFIIAIPIASIFILYLTNIFGIINFNRSEQLGSFLEILPGWIPYEQIKYVLARVTAEKGVIIGCIFYFKSLSVFWFKNFGPWMVMWIILFVVEMIFGITKKRIDWILMLFWFLFFNIVMFAAWDRDNTIKFLIWIFLGTVVLMRQTLIKLYKLLENKFRAISRNNCIRQVVIYLLCFILFFSGGITLLSTTGKRARKQKIFSLSEIYYVRSAVKGISYDAVFASEATYNNPLSFLGYKLTLGYEGHLYSRGYNYYPKFLKLKQLYQGKGDWNSIVKELKGT